MFYLELEADYETFYNAIRQYAEILGKEGLEKYRQLVDAELEKLPPTEKQTINDSLRRRNLTQMKETLVEVTGTWEDLVETIAQDLSLSHDYVRIAELYQQNKQLDQAIEWIQRGLHDCQNWPDSQKDFQIRSFESHLMKLYQEKGQFDEVLAIAWKHFSHSPSLQLYQTLKEKACKAGNWEYWQQQAIAYIEKAIAQLQTNPKSPPYEIQNKSSLLVQIYLQEGEIERAWQQAQKDGCDSHLWMELAAKKEKDAPEDALSVYLPRIEPLIKQTHNEAYNQAITLLFKIEEIMTRLNREKEFTEDLNQLQITYKRKRNFIKFSQNRGLMENK